MTKLPVMSSAVHDERRLAALHNLALLDTAVEPAFDRLTRLAARLLGVPVALLSLVDNDRQFFKSCVGLPEPWATQRETPLSHSFCQYVVESNQPLIVADARTNSRLASNLAIPDLGVIAYLGFPITTSDGLVLGSFCAIDSSPRVWSASDIETIHDLTASVITEIELRSDIAQRDRAEAALDESNARFAGAFAHAPIGMALVAPDGRWLQVNQALCAIVGYSESELLARDFQTITHPDDLQTDLLYLQQLLGGTIDSYQMEKRYFHKHGQVVSILLCVSLVRDRLGQPLYFVAQMQDISYRKQAEREREHLIEQLSDSLNNLKVLRGLLPICASCKKIRDDHGYWNQIEHYLQTYTDARFSHGICPDCITLLYPD